MVENAIVQFTARGHPNILASHARTLEFTKEGYVTPRGDCIVGVSATFTLAQLKSLLRYKEVEITICCGALEEAVTAAVNPGFCHPTELVVRMGDFCSDRTFGIRADKAAADFSPAMRQALRQEGAIVKITITPK